MDRTGKAEGSWFLVLQQKLIIYHSPGQYQLGWRSEHTTAVVGEVLYCWGGNQRGLDVSHDSPTKRECTSAIDAFNLLSGVWSSQPTRGTPPEESPVPPLIIIFIILVVGVAIAPATITV